MSTIGNTNTGAAGTALTADYAYAIKVTPDEDMTIESISVYAGEFGSNNLKAVIWLESDGSVHAASSISTGTTGYSSAWHELGYGSWEQPTLSNGTTYWIGLVAQSSSGVIKYSTTTAYNAVDSSNDYNTPETFGGDNFQRYHCIYATYSGVSSGPGYTIEGQTPAYINTLPWEDVSTIT